MTNFYFQCDTGPPGSLAEFHCYLGRGDEIHRDNRESATANIQPDIEDVESAKVSESSSPPKHDSPPPILSLNEVSSSKQDHPCRSSPDIPRSPSPSLRSPSHSSRYSPSGAHHSPPHSLSFQIPDTDSQYLRKPYMFPDPTLHANAEPSSSSPTFVPKYPWHHPPTSTSGISDMIPNPSLVPLLMPYPSLSHSVIYMSQYMNPFMPTCSGSSLAEKKKRNRTFIDPVSEVMGDNTTWEFEFNHC